MVNKGKPHHSIVYTLYKSQGNPLTKSKSPVTVVRCRYADLCDLMMPTDAASETFCLEEQDSGQCAK
jgi:hypothetical protein